MKTKIRRSLWKVLGGPPQNANGAAARAPTHSWEDPADTIASRNFVVDMAVYNVQISTRLEEPAADGGSPTDRDTLIGDYAEFGVYQGRTFLHAYKRAFQHMPWMRFLAFDSFEGLPEPKGDDVGGEFWAGQFACSRPAFESSLRDHGVDMGRVRIVPGWFDQTLTPQAKRDIDLRVVSIAYIDCDLYESTVPVLDFLTDVIRQGTILIFDDWFHFRGDPRRGVQKAVNEWLARNTDIQLTPWHLFSHHGHSFIVTKR